MMERLFELLSRTFMMAAGAFMTLMAFHVSADIISRVFFRESLEGVTEVVSYYYMVGIVFLPLLVVRKNGALIVADILASFMSQKMIRFLDAASDLLLAAWFFLFAYITADVAMEKTTINEFVETTIALLTIWPTRWFLPLGAAAAGLYCLLEGLRGLAATTSMKQQNEAANGTA